MKKTRQNNRSGNQSFLNIIFFHFLLNWDEVIQEQEESAALPGKGSQVPKGNDLSNCSPFLLYPNKVSREPWCFFDAKFLLHINRISYISVCGHYLSSWALQRSVLQLCVHHTNTDMLWASSQG